MEKRAKGRVSILRRLALLLLVVALLQGVISSCAVFLNGGINYLEKSASSNFSSVVQNRATQMNSTIARDRSYVEEQNMKIQDVLDDYRLQGYHAEELLGQTAVTEAFLRDVVRELAGILKETLANQTFLVLMDQNGQPTGGVILHTDSDKTKTNITVTVESGPASLVRTLSSQGFNGQLSSQWQERLQLNKETSDFIDTGMTAARAAASDMSTDLGVWSDFIQWSETGGASSSYAVPLESGNTVVGMMGMATSRTQLVKTLPYREIDLNDGASYLIAAADDDRYEPLLAAGEQDMDSLTTTPQLTLIPAEKTDYPATVSELSQTFAAAEPLQLYSSNTHLSEAPALYLVGLVDKSTLFEHSDRLKRSILISFGISAVLGIAVSLFGSYQFTKPIIRMSQEISSMAAGDKVELAQSNMLEIDNLGYEISRLNKKIKEDANRVSKIIEMVGLPVGFVEYYDDTDKVFCTEQVAALLRLPAGQVRHNYIDKPAFEQYIGERQLTEQLKTKKAFLYYDQGQDRYIQFRVARRPDRALITLIDVTSETKERLRLEKERDFDSLTGLLNRAAFRTRVQEIMQEPQLGLSAMLMWDLDNLKYVNDTYGHELGDEYIRVAARLIGKLQFSNAVVGRLSGDEFIAFVPNCGSKARLLTRINELRMEFAATKMRMPDNEQLSVRASGGLAWYPEDTTSYDKLIRYADYAMYDTKKSYKGAFKEFELASYEKNALLLEGKEQLNKLIEQQLVRYAYQPIVNARTGAVFAYEALMRPSIEELRSPADVMRLATDQFRLPDIERLTFAGALAGYHAQRAAFGDGKLFVNSIPNQVFDKEYLRRLYAEYEIAPGTVVVEMIESEQADISILEGKLASLKELRCAIAIDDFGSGYNSESALLQMKPDYVKIDMSIVRNIDQDVNRQTIVSNLINYAKNRSIKVIAEGVETAAELRVLIDYGVDYVQGFLLARGEFTVSDIPPTAKQLIRELNAGS